MRTTLLLGPVIALTVGCAAPEPVDSTGLSMRAEVVVTSDPGHGLAGAVLVAAERPIATTAADGSANITLDGVEGDSVPVAVRCPAGYESPPPIRIALRRLSKGSRAPRFDARCAPVERTFVVGIRAHNGPDLPIYRLGKLVGRTDSAGAAHVLVRAKSNEQVAFTIETKTGERRPVLRPENPTLTFVAGERDELVVLEQRFETERTIAPAPSPRRPAPTRVPTPI